jgi:exodeoxyribonuclease VII small subunit
MSETKPSFESSLDQLQQTVKRLESGELGLEQALKCFEEGVKLTRSCQEYLATAEQRIEVLTRASADGKVETQPFK